MEHGPGSLFHIFGFNITSEITTMWGIMIFLIIISLVATKNLKLVPSGLQNIMEYGLETLLNFFGDLMGEKNARKYLPLLASFFIVILISNYSGLLPGSGHIAGLKAPTSNINTTVGLALVVFFTSHFMGIKEKGLGYFKHFIEPFPLLLPLNLIEELVKPLSLSLRLYGNIFGEEMVIASLFAMVPLIVPLPMMLLSLLFGLIQAFVFTLLAAIYINTATAGH
ncbi:ATP synthase F0 subcomplex A subunit [Desulfonispora thiosulfatigenes DSM 11270]|uniref:ATP synthase subunit a n=1 Tax=Desulfonispora thiosulfatigenes DSM 11270 TaxID=656914 RepID=A0A1W1V4H8_DESTI|nr:F0F1 ATP synthase subunit A [Desulfonispora thiosulfatigenes]SMB88206.1 ATP synthase F0 subcomplex A subunit [Desulfonispora thiosulfatigenes DSM 11270]